MFEKSKKIMLTTALVSACAFSTHTFASGSGPNCRDLPSHAQLTTALKSVVDDVPNNGGLGNDMWGTVVNRDGVVCAVFRSGDSREDQWLGSRVISAQKANTANAFSLEGTYPNVGLGRALATGNLYGLVQPGGSLFGLQFSNPVDPSIAYGFDGSPGNAEGRAPRRYGTINDPMVGDLPGGVNVFGGGLALYNSDGEQVGAIGVSGDTSCADHIIAWRVRDAIGLDFIPGGVGDGGLTDNLIINNPPTPNSFEHPTCGFGEDPIIADLSTAFPIGPNP